MNRKTSRGGRRPGAGRPAGTSRFGEPTQPVRIPLGLQEDVRRLLAGYPHGKTAEEMPLFPATDGPAPMALPLYTAAVSAGFPSPAEDHLEGSLDLNALLIRHPAATFFVRVAGDSMTGAGIHSGDILVVDRSLEAVDGRIVVAALNGELTVKRLRLRHGGRLLLEAENPAYPPIPVAEENDFMVWGVVTSVVHQL